MMKSFEDHWPSGVSLTDFLSWPIRRLEDQMMMKMVVTVGGSKECLLRGYKQLLKGLWGCVCVCVCVCVRR